MKGHGILRGGAVSEFTEKPLILLNCPPTNWLLINPLDIWTSTDLSYRCSVLNISTVEKNIFVHGSVKLFHHPICQNCGLQEVPTSWDLNESSKKANTCILYCSGFMYFRLSLFLLPRWCILGNDLNTFVSTLSLTKDIWKVCC